MQNDPHLTEGYDFKGPVSGSMITATHPGMASWSIPHELGTPSADRHTCATCAFFGWREGPIDYVDRNGVQRTRYLYRRHRCVKYRLLMGRIGPAVPATAPGCRYWVRREGYPYAPERTVSRHYSLSMALLSASDA